MTIDSSRSLTPQYALHQSFFWMAYCGLFSFAAAYLLDRGFDSSQVGTILALTSLLSCLLQPLAASVADRSSALTLPQMIAGLTALSAAALIALHFAALPHLLFGAFFLLSGLLLDATQPLLNSLSVYYVSRGRRLDFGVGRGIGSLAFAAASVGLGRAMKSCGSESMILITLALLLCCAAVTLFYPSAKEKSTDISRSGRVKQADACSLPEFFRRYRRYCLSLAGVLFLAAFHAMSENYFITLMQSLGGDSSHVGIALAVATVAEVPVFLFFTRIHRRLGTGAMLHIAAATFLAKSVLLLLARSIPAVYAAEVLQATSYGFLIPAGVAYARERTGERDMVKGQALFTAAYALGCSLGNYLGGRLISLSGIRLLLAAGVALAACGTAVLFAAVRPGRASD